MRKKERIAKQICDALKMFYLKCLITPLRGNISVKLGDTILMTPSSFVPKIRLKYELKPEDLVEVNLNRNVIKGGCLTTGLPIHLVIYRECEKYKAIVHIPYMEFTLLCLDQMR